MCTFSPRLCRSQRTPPSSLTHVRINREILALPGVFEIHEQHFWQLVDGLVIASMHVRVDSTVAWSQVRSSITSVLHLNGVHNMTLQPEFLSVGGHRQEEGCCFSRLRGWGSFKRKLGLKIVFECPVCSVLSQRGTGEEVILGACTEEGSCVTGCQAEPCCPKPTSTTVQRRSPSNALSAT